VKHIDVNGIDAYYIDEGEGETLLILHGWGCDASVYAGVVAFLSARFRVILPELPGFGNTPEPPEPWGVSEYTAFISAFRSRLGISESTLFAHSLGCRIAIKLLSGGELSAKRVIFTGAAGVKPKPTFKGKMRARLYKVAKLILSPNPKALERLRQRSGSPDYRAASPTMRQCLVKIVNEDLTPLLPAIKQSVLLIWGSRDDSTPLADGKLMESLIPEAGLAVIDNVGHYAFLEQPHLFNKILESYLK